MICRSGRGLGSTYNSLKSSWGSDTILISGSGLVSTLDILVSTRLGDSILQYASSAYFRAFLVIGGSKLLDELLVCSA